MPVPFFRVTSTWNGEGALTGDGWQGGVNIGAVGTSAGMDISWASGQGAMKETSDTISFNFTE